MIKPRKDSSQVMLKLIFFKQAWGNENSSPLASPVLQKGLVQILFGCWQAISWAHGVFPSSGSRLMCGVYFSAMEYMTVNKNKSLFFSPPHPFSSSLPVYYIFLSLRNHEVIQPNHLCHWKNLNWKNIISIPLQCSIY